MTNYVIPVNKPHPNPIALGLLVIHETQAQDGSVNPCLSLSSSPIRTVMTELVKKILDLFSCNARYVRFQDRALLTLQQLCQRLETLN